MIDKITPHSFSKTANKAKEHADEIIFSRVIKLLGRFFCKHKQRFDNACAENVFRLLKIVYPFFHRSIFPGTSSIAQYPAAL